MFYGFNLRIFENSHRHTFSVTKPTQRKFGVCIGKKINRIKQQQRCSAIYNHSACRYELDSGSTDRCMKLSVNNSVTVITIKTKTFERKIFNGRKLPHVAKLFIFSLWEG